MRCSHLIGSCGSEWFQSALTATISPTRRKPYRTAIENTFDFGQSGSYVKSGTYRATSCILKTLQSPGALYASELPYPHSREREKIGAS